jgi:hypothetical protein
MEETATFTHPFIHSLECIRHSQISHTRKEEAANSSYCLVGIDEFGELLQKEMMPLRFIYFSWEAKQVK